MENTFTDQLAQSDFDRARQRSFFRRAWAFLSGQENRLLSYDEVREKLHIGGMAYRGLQAVPLDKVVGSVNRYHDFDNAFLPTQSHTRGRWKSISRAFYQEVNLPPVQLYQVGEIYFVSDGNHRVSVAREKGAEFIDAEVHECDVRVAITRDIKADDLIILGEKTEFLEQTQLDRLFPEADIQLTILGGYLRLLEHIAVRRYYLGIEWQRHFTQEEAVINWYDLVYLPLVEIIRQQDMLREFPHRTEGDLYLWIMDHKHYLLDQFEDDLDAAAADFADHHSERPVKKLINAVGNLVEDLAGGEE